jgi:hypothetical protein
MTQKHPRLLAVIQTVRAHIQWKPNSAERHLQKRKQRKHLPPTASLADYERVILTVLQDKTAQVYHYWYNHIPYVTVVARVEAQMWLVMFGYDGVMESAFVLEQPERYLNKPEFEKVGSLSEVDDEL